jgi:plasmid rolling circle replication initiator protein Rep
VKASQRRVFFGHKLYPYVESLINRNPTVKQLWVFINLKNPEDGDDAFSETSIRTRATRAPRRHI